MDAVSHQYQDTRGVLARAVGVIRVRMRAMPMGSVSMTPAMVLAVPCGVRVPAVAVLFVFLLVV